VKGDGSIEVTKELVKFVGTKGILSLDGRVAWVANHNQTVHKGKWVLKTVRDGWTLDIKPPVPDIEDDEKPVITIKAAGIGVVAVLYVKPAGRNAKYTVGFPHPILDFKA